jgi:hypothetical protein
MSQTKPHPKRPPPPSQVRWRVFSAGFPCGDTRSAKIIRRFDPPHSGKTYMGEIVLKKVSGHKLLLYAHFLNIF